MDLELETMMGKKVNTYEFQEFNIQNMISSIIRGVMKAFVEYTRGL